MSVDVLALVVAAAFAHAGWNLLAKPAVGGAAFVWLCGVAGTVLYLPVLVVALVGDPGPLLSATAAIALLGERLSALGIVGAAVIVAAVFSLIRRSGGSEPASARGTQATVFALLTGSAIAAYTLWDKHAVGTAALSPILLGVVALALD